MDNKNGQTNRADGFGSRGKKLLAGLGAAAVWFGVWQLVAAVIDKEILVPSPAAVIRRLCELVATGDFWLQTGGTLLRVTAGFILALAVGSLLGAAMHFSKWAQALFSPLLSVIRATPVTSFIILALVWIKSAFMPVFIAFLMVLPIICGNLGEGLSQTDPKLLEMAELYGIRGLRRVRAVWLPSVAPYVLAACRTGLGFAWKAGVAAEVIGRTARSIGNMLYESKLYLETVDLFAWTVVVVVLSRVLERALVAAAEGLSKRYSVHTEPNGEEAENE